VFEAVNSGENLEKQGCSLNLFRVLEQLDKEVQSLSSQKEDLLIIEEKLWFMLSEEAEAKRTKITELRREVEDLKRKCVELTRILNANIRER